MRKNYQISRSLLNITVRLSKNQVKFDFKRKSIEKSFHDFETTNG